MNTLYSNLSNLVNIPSITRSNEEIEIYKFIENLLENIISTSIYKENISINKIESRDEYWDYHWWIVCNIKGSDLNKTIWLLWHLDVVPVNWENWKTHPFKITEKDWNIYGRWVCDMKAWVVIMIEVLKKALKQVPNKNISLIFTTWEECWLPNWLTKLIERGLLKWLDFVIALEPTWWKINTWVFWYLDWEFLYKWKTCHSSKPFLWENAIHKTAWLLTYLQNPDIICTMEYFWEEVAEVLSATNIKWWIACNSIPDFCSVQINHRYSPHKDWNKILTKFRRIAKRFWAEKFEVIEHNPSSKIVDIEDKLLKDFMCKIKWNTRMISIAPFWSDISQTSTIWIPSINFWPWDINQAHTDDEFISKKSFEETYYHFINYFFN